MKSSHNFLSSQVNHAPLNQDFTHYETKKHYTHQEFKPDTWGMGEEVNAVLPRAEPEVVTEA